jgi:hypothetical protein
MRRGSSQRQQEAVQKSSMQEMRLPTQIRHIRPLSRVSAGFCYSVDGPQSSPAFRQLPENCSLFDETGRRA